MWLLVFSILWSEIPCGFSCFQYFGVKFQVVSRVFNILEWNSMRFLVFSFFQVRISFKYCWWLKDDIIDFSLSYLFRGTKYDDTKFGCVNTSMSKDISVNKFERRLSKRFTNFFNKDLIFVPFKKGVIAGFWQLLRNQGRCCLWISRVRHVYFTSIHCIRTYLQLILHFKKN